MSDPYAVWRAAEGKSVQKSVRTFWPELAAALDGAGGGAAPAGKDTPKQPEHPDCEYRGPFCAGKAAGIMKDSGRYACIPCWNGRRGFVRNPAWTAQRNPRKATGQERWDNR